MNKQELIELIQKIEGSASQRANKILVLLVKHLEDYEITYAVTASLYNADNAATPSGVTQELIQFSEEV